jgi:Domain of unknown function (DUF4280)
MERVKGIEPSSQAWEAHILPLDHTRNRGAVSNFGFQMSSRLMGSHLKGQIWLEVWLDGLKNDIYMGQLVVSGAMMTCSFGAAPAALSVLPANKANAGGPPAATIMDSKPMVNIPTFGMCQCPANPQVAAATAAALGVLTPQPCIPNTSAPWTPGSPKVMIGGMPALNNSSTCMCTWGGVIQITSPGQTTTNVA